MNSRPPPTSVSHRSWSTTSRCELNPSIRPRRNEDIATLARLLEEQQPGSGYPNRWPLPYPPEQFIARDGELGAWSALLDGEVVGHVSLQQVDGNLQAPEFRAVFGGAESLGIVSALFTGTAARGRGVGRALLDTAVQLARESGLRPVLDVAQANQAAIALYKRAGWRVAGTARPHWLLEDEPDVLFMTLDAIPPTNH